MNKSGSSPKNKVGGSLSKVLEDDNECVNEDAINQFFDINEDEEKLIRECHEASYGKEG